MKVQKNGTIVGIMQSEDPVMVRVQVKLDEDSLEQQRVKPFPQNDQERMAEQMTEQIARQLRGLVPGAMIVGPGMSGLAGGPRVEEWLVPSDEASRLSVGKRVRVSLELLED